MFLCKENTTTFAPSITVRGGAEVARWAHNPKVIGSSPIPATNKDNSDN